MKYAVLGLLIERRGYGYDLANRLQQRLGPDFRAAFGAVYVSLDQLCKERLVAEAKRVQAGRQIKVFYEATPAGRERFAEWMASAPAREPLRGDLYLKLAVAQSAHLPLLRDELERMRRDCARELEERSAAAAAASAAAAAPQAAAPHAGAAPPGAAGAVPWAAAVRWLADAAVLERLHGDLRWLATALRALDAAGPDGSVPRELLLAAAPAAAA